MLAGGLFYTGGVPFYVWKSRRYTHAVWHLFVLAGVACHFVAVLSVVEHAEADGYFLRARRASSSQGAPAF